MRRTLENPKLRLILQNTGSVPFKLHSPEKQQKYEKLSQTKGEDMVSNAPWYAGLDPRRRKEHSGGKKIKSESILESIYRNVPPLL